MAEPARKGITVNAIAPGFIQTNMLKGVPEEIKSRLLGQIPMGRFEPIISKELKVMDTRLFREGPMDLSF